MSALLKKFIDSRSKISISRSTFENIQNSGFNQALSFVDAVITVDSCIFRNSISISNFPSIFSISATFLTQTDINSIFAAINANANITNTTFINNSGNSPVSQISFYGTIANVTGSTLISIFYYLFFVLFFFSIMFDWNYNSNIAQVGTIVVDGQSDVSFRNMVFDSNVAYEESASCTVFGSAYFHNCTFTKNNGITSVRVMWGVINCWYISPGLSWGLFVHWCICRIW